MTHIVSYYCLRTMTTIFVLIVGFQTMCNQLLECLFTRSLPSKVVFSLCACNLLEPNKYS